MPFTNTDGRNLERVAEALERIADADERRNELLVEDAKGRALAWERERQETLARWGELTGVVPAPSATIRPPSGP